MTSAPRGEFQVHPDCRAAVEVTAAALDELGFVVEAAYPPALDDSGFAVEAPKIMPLGFAAFAFDWWRRRSGIEFGPDDVEPWTWICVKRGRGLSAVDYLSAVEYVQAWTRRLTSIRQ